MSSAVKIIRLILNELVQQSRHITVSYLDSFAGILERPLGVFSWNFEADFGWCPFVVPGWQITELKFNSHVVWSKILNQSFDQVRIACSAFVQSPELDGSDESDQRGSLFDGLDSGSRFAVTTNVNEKDLSDVFWRQHGRPNFFLCQRVCCPDFIDKAAKVQEYLCQLNEMFRPMLYTPEMFHLTLCTLSLDSVKGIADCFEVLRKACKSARRLIPREPLQMVGVSTFDSRVLFVDVRGRKMLAPFVTHLNSALRSAGYRIPPGSRFSPHITLMKLNKKQYRRLKIDRSIVDKHSNVEFGSLLLRELHLCLMGASRDDQGFYRSYGSISFRPVD